MDNLIDSLKKVNISKNPTNIPEQIILLISNDIDLMIYQMIHNGIQHTPITFKLFEYLYRCSIVELNIIKEYVDKNGYQIINDKLKNTGLAYSIIDATTYIDYYSDQIDEFISLMDGC
jgi:malate/lactate dehydrogenase